jgi:hypothetical protein
VLYITFASIYYDDRQAISKIRKLYKYLIYEAIVHENPYTPDIEYLMDLKRLQELLQCILEGFDLMHCQYVSFYGLQMNLQECPPFKDFL